MESNTEPPQIRDFIPVSPTLAAHLPQTEKKTVFLDRWRISYQPSTFIPPHLPQEGQKMHHRTQVSTRATMREQLLRYG